MPLNLHPNSKQLFIIEIPSESSLGTSDSDFSNVKIWLVDLDGNHVCEPPVHICANGKLGTLKGGLLHLSDARDVLTKQDLQKLAIQDTSGILYKKRTPVTKGFTVQQGKGRTD